MTLVERHTGEGADRSTKNAGSSRPARTTSATGFHTALRKNGTKPDGVTVRDTVSGDESGETSLTLLDDGSMTTNASPVPFAPAARKAEEGIGGVTGST